MIIVNIVRVELFPVLPFLLIFFQQCRHSIPPSIHNFHPSPYLPFFLPLLSLSLFYTPLFPYPERCFSPFAHSFLLDFLLQSYFSYYKPFFSASHILSCFLYFKFFSPRFFLLFKVCTALFSYSPFFRLLFNKASPPCLTSLIILSPNSFFSTQLFSFSLSAFFLLSFSAAPSLEFLIFSFLSSQLLSFSSSPSYEFLIFSFLYNQFSPPFLLMLSLLQFSFFSSQLLPSYSHPSATHGCPFFGLLVSFLSSFYPSPTHTSSFSFLLCFSLCPS